MNLTPNKKDRKKFDIDLAYGKVREDLIKEMLQDKKIEVKSERDVWKRTGNIAIEYQCYGKPSGINATEADYWFHNLCVGEDVYATLVFKTENLKKIIDSLASSLNLPVTDLIRWNDEKFIDNIEKSIFR